MLRTFGFTSCLFILAFACLFSCKVREEEASEAKWNKAISDHEINRDQIKGFANTLYEIKKAGKGELTFAELLSLFAANEKQIALVKQSGRSEVINVQCYVRRGTNQHLYCLGISNGPKPTVIPLDMSAAPKWISKIGVGANLKFAKQMKIYIKVRSKARVEVCGTSGLGIGKGIYSDIDGLRIDIMNYDKANEYAKGLVDVGPFGDYPLKECK